MERYNSSYTGSDGDQNISEGLNNQPKENVAWDDLVNSLIGKRLNSITGKVAYNYPEASIDFSPNGDITNDNDVVIFSMQKPHSMSNTAPNNTMNLHMHWEQIDAVSREITLRYRIQVNGATKTTAWTEVVVDTNANNAFTYDSGTINQITELAQIDLSEAGLSATIQFRMTRSDAVSGDIAVTFVDAHIPYDQLGSRQEYIK